MPRQINARDSGFIMRLEMKGIQIRVSIPNHATCRIIYAFDIMRDKFGYIYIYICMSSKKNITSLKVNKGEGSFEAEREESNQSRCG